MQCSSLSHSELSLLEVEPSNTSVAERFRPFSTAVSKKMSSSVSITARPFMLDLDQSGTPGNLGSPRLSWNPAY